MRELTNSFDTYWQELFPDPSELFNLAKQESHQIGKAPISITAAEGRLLCDYIKKSGAKKFVEVGCLTGYSALWIAYAMQDGQLWTFEKDEKTAERARHIFKQCPWGQIDLIVGDASQTLTTIEKFGPFDGIFIDGNKQAYPHYLKWAETHVKKQGLIIADNVWLGGTVFGHKDERFSDKQVAAMRDFNKRLSDPAKFDGFIVPTKEGMYVTQKLF